MQALWIELEEPPLHYSAEIYCADGTLVNTAPLQTAGQRIFMQMPPMVTPGIYFLKIGNTIYKVAIE